MANELTEAELRSLMPFNPARTHAAVPRAAAPAAAPSQAPHAAAWLDSARDRLDGLLNPGKPVVAAKRFYKDGVLAGHMQLQRKAVRS